MKATNEKKISRRGTFTADKDYYKRTEDGRRILLARKGVEMPYAEAVELGIIESEEAEAPEEKPEEKAEAPEANKAAVPAENKTAGKKK